MADEKENAMAGRNRGTPAKNIDVKSFRLLYQWPLYVVPEGGKTDIAAIRSCVGKTRDLLEQVDGGWSGVDPLDYPGFDEHTDRNKSLSPAYGEFLYFHDFVQKFLFPRDGDNNPAFELFYNTRFRTAECKIDNKLTIDFDINRHSIHLFSSGIAVVTVELEASGLNLADVMTVMDQMRRSYVPYFESETKAGGVRERVTLGGCKGEPVSLPPDEKTAHRFLNPDNRKDEHLRPAMLDHWKAFASPLQLLGDGGNWRDLSDERLPFNGYISLTDREFTVKSEDEQNILTPKQLKSYQTDEKLAARKDRHALLNIRQGDWMRLAEADGPREAEFNYNPAFLKNLKDRVFYDRFFPDAQSGNNATRHIFSAAHYCVVGAGNFADGLLLNHWRRHYANLTLIARFELASLLAISSRISRIAQKYDPYYCKTDDRQYEDALLDVQQQFALFEHRFRFTGVSSQIQPTEMFARLRGVMGLDVIYADVKNEIGQAAARVRSLQQSRAADTATRLNQLATIGLFLAFVVSAAGMNLFIDSKYWPAASTAFLDDLWRFMAVVLVCTASFAGLLLLFPHKHDGFLRRFRVMLMWIFSISALVIAGILLRGGIVFS